MDIWNILLNSIAVFLTHVSYCSSKSSLETQSDIFKDIASKLRAASEYVPTQEQVIEKIKSIDAEELKKIDEKIEKEESEISKDHGSCGSVSYERDYSFECPDGWVLNEDGSCWGLKYKGNCDSRQYFKWFSVDQKKDIESKCCAYWPRKQTVKETLSKAGKLQFVHGSVNSHDGKIIPPRN